MNPIRPALRAEEGTVAACPRGSHSLEVGHAFEELDDGRRCCGVARAGSALASGVNKVYVSNPDMDRIYAIDTAAGTGQVPTEVLHEPGSSYEDLVVAPDGALFACDPTAGKIIRIDLSTAVVTTIHESGADGAPLTRSAAVHPLGRPRGHQQGGRRCRVAVPGTA